MSKVMATESFHVATKKSGLVSVVKGQAYDEKDPVVKAAPSKFVTADEWVETKSEVVVHHAVEAATAAPGETRAVKKPKAKPKAKAAK